MKTQSFTLHTEQQGCYDITAAVCKSISDAGIQSGICTVFCPHTTAGIWIGENTAARYGERREDISHACRSARASEISAGREWQAAARHMAECLFGGA